MASESEAVGVLERLSGERAAQHYAAIVESSHDAILSKDLNGVITSWNRAGHLLFGHTAEEAVVTILITMDRHDEEPFILGRIRRGQRVDHYETIRQRKDGSHIHMSLTVSPIRNEKGEIVGASKIARDITEKSKRKSGKRLCFENTVFCFRKWTTGSRTCLPLRSAFWD